MKKQFLHSSFRLIFLRQTYYSHVHLTVTTETCMTFECHVLFSFPPPPHHLFCVSILSSLFFLSLMPEHHCLKMQQSSVVCCQDHNYGAPPPPTPPASPLSQTIIPRLELNGTLGRPRARFHVNDPDNSADSESSSEEEEGAVPAGWCQCRFTPDSYLIKCENCR